jgi:hypothetical protein
MLILDLLITDGTGYGILYKWNKSNSCKGKLFMKQGLD